MNSTLKRAILLTTFAVGALAGLSTADSSEKEEKERQRLIEGVARKLSPTEDASFLVVFVVTPWDGGKPGGVYAQLMLIAGREKASKMIAWFITKESKLKQLHKNRSTPAPKLAWKLIARFDSSEFAQEEARIVYKGLKSSVESGRVVPFVVELKLGRKLKRYVVPFREMVPDMDRMWANGDDVTRSNRGLDEADSELKKADRDKDGVLDQGEANQIAGLDFQRCDEDGDRRLSPAEVERGFILKRFWESEPDANLRVKAKGQRRNQVEDIDGDGFIDQDEWITSYLINSTAR